MNGHLTRQEIIEVQQTPKYPGVIKALATKYNVSEDLIKHVRNKLCLRLS